MQQIGKISNAYAYKDKPLTINAIPINMEKYMAFILGNHLTFIDNFKLMSSSLDKLVNNLPKDDLIYTSQVFKGKKLDLMSKKGIYPYDFMDTFEKFDEMELPTKEQFYSTLNDQHITNDEYDHAKRFGRLLKLRQWVSTMAYTLEAMCSCWLMYLKASERPAYNTTN